MAVSLNERSKFYIFGIPINAMTMDQALDYIDHSIKKKNYIRLGVVNAAKIVNMRRNLTLRNDVLSSDFIFADGKAVVLASRLMQQPLPERIAGIDLMVELIRRGNNSGYRVFLLGAKEAVSKAVAQKINEDYPGLKIAGRHNGYFLQKDEEVIAKKIKDSNSDILFVAMPSPKKEKFMARWGKQINVPIIHGVGGSFDVFTGNVRRAPEAWQRLGLEWLYRFKQEPKRLFKRYLITNTLFIVMVIKAVFLNSGNKRVLPRI